MSTILFDTGDMPYLNWLIENSEGYVLNVLRSTPKYHMLHHSYCDHISNSKGQAKDAFTTQDSFKICAPKMEWLKEWLRREHNVKSDEFVMCKSCKPDQLKQVRFQGQTITRGRVLSVLTEFDRQFKETNSYDNWMEKKTYKYAIRYQNRLYPCKYILSLAAGVPNSGYSGGERTNAVFRGLGFRVIEKTGIPPQSSQTQPSSPLIQLTVGEYYSREQIHQYVGGGSLESYLPSKDGRILCGCFDPLKNPGAPVEISIGDSPFTLSAAELLANSRTAIPVFLKESVKRWAYIGEFQATGLSKEANDIENQREDAIAVLYLEAFRTNELLSDVDEEFYQAEGLEGKMVVATHSRRERNPTLAKTKKRVFKSEHGKLICEACATSASDFPDAVGDACFEVHHLLPISELADETITKLNDLVILCANCHRMIHRTSPLMTIEAFRRLLESRMTQLAPPASA